MPNTLNAAMPRVMADVKDLLKLAWPVILNRAGVFSLSVVDTIMVGQYAATELAYLGVGQVPMGIAILLAIGLLMGTMVLSSAHFGAGEYQQCGVVWWRSLPFALLIGGIGFVICFLVSRFCCCSASRPILPPMLGAYRLFWVLACHLRL